MDTLRTVQIPRRLIGLLTIITALGCESSDGDEAAANLGDNGSGLQQRIPLTDQATWSVVSESDDPFGGPGDKTPCIADRDMMSEKEFSGFWYTVATRHCAYGTAKTTLKNSVPKGATLRARFFHFTVNKDPGSWRIALAIGDSPDIIMDKTYPIPAKTALFDEEIVASRDFKAGETVYWHVDNHGVNDWSLLELTAVGPLNSCALTDTDCTSAGNCGWYGHCSINKTTCQCEVKTNEQCRASQLCSYYGLCIVKNGVCVADSTADCKASTHCEYDGLCTAKDDECIAANNDDCLNSQPCKFNGMCHAVGNGCAAKTDADCQKAESCRHGGQCSEMNGACRALTDKDCSQSRECSASNPCTIQSGYCVPESGGQGGEKNQPMPQ